MWEFRPEHRLWLSRFQFPGVILNFNMALQFHAKTGLHLPANFLCTHCRKDCMRMQLHLLVSHWWIYKLKLHRGLIYLHKVFRFVKPDMIMISLHWLWALRCKSCYDWNLIKGSSIVDRKSENMITGKGCIIRLTVFGAIAEYLATRTLHNCTAPLASQLTQCIFAPLSCTPEVEWYLL